jgi:hypothetical protein
MFHNFYDTNMSHSTKEGLVYGCIARPLQNAPSCPISASGSNFNPQNTQCIPAVKILAFLELEQK